MRIILIFLSCFFCTTTFGQKLNNAYKYSIVFAACFQNDLVELKINEVLLISSQKITSDLGNGVTGLAVYQDDKAIWVSNKVNKEQFPLLTVKKSILLDITLNGKSTIFNVDFKKGRIIFIDNCFVNSGGTRKQILTIRQYKKTVPLY
jgi:hypothetical protein